MTWIGGCRGGLLRRLWVLEREALAVLESRYQAPSVLSLHPVHLLLAFNNQHHLKQFIDSLSSSRCEYHQSSSSYAPYGPTLDGREGVDGRHIFAHEPFNLAGFV